MFFSVLEQLGESLPDTDGVEPLTFLLDQRIALEAIQSEILENGPSLSDALFNAYSGDPSWLAGRISQFQGHHIPTQPLLYLYGLGLEGKAPVELLENHSFVFSAADSQRVLDERLGVEADVVPLKTVTLKIKSQAGIPMVIPVIGAGDFTLSREEIKAIADAYQPIDGEDYDPAFVPATSSKAMKGCTINPREFDTRVLLGLEPGIVGPFTATGTMDIHPIGSMCFIRHRDDDNQMVGIAATPFDTICTDLQTLEQVIALPGNIPIKTVLV